LEAKEKGRARARATTTSRAKERKAFISPTLQDGTVRTLTTGTNNQTMKPSTYTRARKEHTRRDEHHCHTSTPSRWPTKSL
jgi:hypothetical protein